jgi:hypothetical protein
MPQTLSRRCAFCAFSFLDPFPRPEKCGTLACKAGQKFFLIASLCRGPLRMRTHAVLGNAAGQPAAAGPYHSLIPAAAPVSVPIHSIGTLESGHRTARSPITGRWSQVAGHRSPVTGRRSRATGRCISPLECAVTKKRVCNSFGIRTYKSLDLKSPGMNSYKKHRGVGVACVLQTQDLSRIFHGEGRTSYKPLDLKSPAMNSYKNTGVGGT